MRLAKWLAIPASRSAKPGLGRRRFSRDVRLRESGQSLGSRSAVASAVAALRRTARWELALKLLGEMPEASLQPDTVNFNATLLVCASASAWNTAVALLGAMPSKEVLPDTRSYNSVLAALDHAAEAGQAVQCMAQMRLLRVPPDAASYSSLMSALTRSGEWRAAIQVFAEMRVQRDAVCFSVAMGACEKASEWAKALELFQALAQQRLRHDAVTFGNAVCAMTKGGHWLGVLELLQCMQSEAVKLDTVVCNSALTACANHSRWQDALHLVSIMTQLKLAKTTATCNATIRSLEKAGEHRRAVEVLLHEFASEDPLDQGFARPSMFRSTRPVKVTAALKEALAERLERALRPGDYRAESRRAAEPPEPPRPVVAVEAAAFGPGPAPASEWCTIRAQEAFDAVLKHLRPTTEAALQEAQALAQKLEATVPAHYVDVKVMVYGSVTGRFAAQDADADFTVLLPWDEADSGALRAFQQRVLVELRRELLARGWHVSTVGLGGRVPVLTFHWGPGLSRTADVTVRNYLGLHKSALLREYSLLDERLCDLVVAVKRWAELRGLSGQTRGYPGGYSWSLLALSFAQRAAPPLVPSLQALATKRRLWEESGECYNVAWASAADAEVKNSSGSPEPWTSPALLEAFFRFFAYGYDFNVEAASVRLAERARRSVVGRPALALEDPLETDWDLGRLLDEQRLARLRAELRRAARRLRGGPSESSLKAVFARRGLRSEASRT
ncbi:URT1 [Symbiodinium sp. CCMP2456]|nr:URT1 [Symbiodinium sp. CCMP2456]